jgi:hypothetical protein
MMASERKQIRAGELVYSRPWVPSQYCKEKMEGRKQGRKKGRTS